MKPGVDSHRRPTQRDVADYVGASTATVSAVISGNRYVSPELKSKIEAAIVELGYVPDIVARSMRTNQTMTIGLMLPNILSPIWARVARGAQDIARSEGYSAVFYDTDEQAEQMMEGLTKLQQQRVDGIILAPCGSCDELLASYIQRSAAPIALVDRALEGCDLDTVVSDSERGTYQAIEHFLETGRQRIGILTLSLDISTGRDRLKGYKQALAARGLPIDEDLIIVGGSGEEEGYQGMQQLLAVSSSQRPDAVMVCSHMMTIGALKALREHEMDVPQDTAIIGFDDLPWTSLIQPALTVVRQSAYDMGAQAVKMLLKRLDEGVEAPTQRLVLGTALVHRESCCQS